MSEYELSRRIRHEANYIDATPLDTRMKRDVTIRRLRQCAVDVDCYANEHAALKREVERLRDGITFVIAESLGTDISDDWVRMQLNCQLTTDDHDDETDKRDNDDLKLALDKCKFYATKALLDGKDD